MKAVIIGFRQGRSTQYTNQFILESKSVTSAEKAKVLIGKKVVWTTPSGKTINGKVSATHGGNGRVRARFEKGLPGQAVGTTLEVKD